MKIFIFLVLLGIWFPIFSNGQTSTTSQFTAYDCNGNATFAMLDVSDITPAVYKKAGSSFSSILSFYYACAADAGNIGVTVDDADADSIFVNDMVVSGGVAYDGFLMCHGWSMTIDLLPSSSTAPLSYDYLYIIVDAMTGATVEISNTGAIEIGDLYEDGGYYLVYGYSYDPTDTSCYELTDSIVPFYTFPLLLVELLPGSLQLDSVNCIYEFDVTVTGGCGGGYDIELLAGDYTQINDTLFHVYNIPSTEATYIIDAQCHIGCKLASTVVIPAVFCPPPVVHTIAILDTVYNYEVVEGVLYIDTVIVTDTISFSTPSSGDYWFTDETISIDTVHVIDDSGLFVGALDTLIIYDTLTVTSTSVIVDTTTIGGITAYDSLVVYHSLTVITVTLSGVMALHLAYFNGVEMQNYNAISWLDYAWRQNTYYELNVSSDGINFNPLTQIQAASAEGNYSYHHTIANQSILYYQLKSVEPNGSATLSNIIFVNNKHTQAFGATITQIANKVIIDCVGLSSNGEFQLINGNGGLVSQGELQPGSNSLDLEGLNAGIYFLQIKHVSDVVVHKIALH